MRWLNHIILTLIFMVGLTLQSNAEVYSIQPIGHVVKTAGKVALDILPQVQRRFTGTQRFFSHLCFLLVRPERFTGKKVYIQSPSAGKQRKSLNRSLCYPFPVSAKSHRVVNMQNQIHR